MKLPSERTLYRLMAKLTDGTHTFGSAVTRRSRAHGAVGPFGEREVFAPGEIMQIDSTPLDVLVLLDSGVTGKVDLTGMIDVATRTLTAAVLRPTTKSVDASVLLARTVTPEPMRPGWADALAMSRSVLPHRRLLQLDGRLAHAAARPVIVPETIVCDHGKVFISRNFQSSCRFLQIEFQPTHKGSPFEKAISRRCSARWPACSPSSWPATPAAAPTTAAATWNGSGCGPCWKCRSCWTIGLTRPPLVLACLPTGRLPSTQTR
ncbi:hypothetical protein ABZW32_34770 [Streptomyces sp. NPDC004667]|uniref:hypothetical protein n=1 Tax=Streptomyces sp. NPDC004667 TaxID=3154285 RepID=UPI0033B2B85A